MADLDYLDNYVERLINSSDKKITDKSGGERFSIKKTKNIAYSEQLSLIENKKLNGSNSLYVGMPSNELQSIGISNNPFAMNQSDFRKSRRDSGNNQHYSSHGIPIDFFEKLPTKINSAPLVIDNGNKATIITDYQMNDKKGQKSYVIVGIIKNQVMENDTVNLIKSIYPLDDFINLIVKYSNNQQLVVLNKNKAEKLLTTIGIQPSEVSRILNLANDSIHRTEQKSQEKISDEKFSTGMLERLRYNNEDHARRLLRSNKIPVNDENIKYYSEKLKEVTKLYNKGKNSRADYVTGLILKSMICPFQKTQNNRS